MNKLLLALAVTLTLTPDAYHVTFDKQMDEVHLIVWSDSNETPYLQIQSADVSQDQTSIDIPRQPLDPGSYVIQAEQLAWHGCPEMCYLASGGSSPTVIIKVPQPQDQP